MIVSVKRIEDFLGEAEVEDVVSSLKRSEFLPSESKSERIGW
jgi:hypothetical protein